jgi:hypothetical protein
MMIENQVLRQSIERLMPSRTLEEGLRDLLLQQARRNLVKYRAMAQRFQSKYKTDFKSFRQKVLAEEPDFETEQDYFDWEMAVTGIGEMEQEIQQLESLL